MATNESRLTDPHYGYDIIVATTEASINATMKKYLSGVPENTITYICHIKPSRTSGLKLVPYDELLRLTKGSDPFKIKNGEVVDENPDIRNIADARFVAGIKVTLGLPNNYDDDALATLPKIIELQRNGTVTYRMMCADIQSDKRNQTWNLVSNVNLQLSKDAPYDEQPPAVQAQIKNLSGTMFEVQQLLFDLNNAGLASVPKVEGLPTDSETQILLTKYFISTYFDTVKRAGESVLNNVVLPKRTEQEATLKPTDLNFHIGPLVKKDPSLKTLDYLCAVNNNPLPPPTDFAWDWVTAEEQKQAHGVIAINRKAFADYIRNLLVKDTKELCFIPYVRCWVDGLANQYTTAPHYFAKSEDECGAGGALGAIVNECKYYANVVAKGNALEVESGYIAHLYVRNTQTRADADVINKDRLELAVDDKGKMVVKTTSTSEDRHYEDRASGFTNFWAEVNDVFDSFKQLDYSGCTFEGVKIAALQDFIFPGGQTLAFKGSHFSDNQDLIASITYADPH